MTHKHIAEIIIVVRCTSHLICGVFMQNIYDFVGFFLPLSLTKVEFMNFGTKSVFCHPEIEKYFLKIKVIREIPKIMPK